MGVQVKANAHFLFAVIPELSFVKLFTMGALTITIILLPSVL